MAKRKPGDISKPTSEEVRRAERLGKKLAKTAKGNLDIFPSDWARLNGTKPNKDTDKPRKKCGMCGKNRYLSAFGGEKYCMYCRTSRAK